MFAARKISKTEWAVVFLAVYVFLYFFTHAPFEAFLSSDSSGYLRFRGYRTFGFPFFVRLMAILSDRMGAISVGQALVYVTAVASVCFAVHRLFQNSFYTLITALILFLNATPLFYSSLVLADSLFYSAVCFWLASVALAIKKTTYGRLAAIGFWMVVAITIRPVGVFFFLVLPGLALIFCRHGWKKILAGLVAPFVGFCFLYCLSNYFIFGYFGFSKFAGYTTLSNTVFLMKEDLKSDHPEFVARLWEFGKPYRSELNRIEGERAKHDFMVLSSPPMILGANEIFEKYLEEKGLQSNTRPPERYFRFLNWINDLSPLNRQYGKMSPDDRDYGSRNDILQQIAQAAYFSNLPELFVFQIRKMAFGAPYFGYHFLRPGVPAVLEGNVAKELFYLGSAPTDVYFEEKVLPVQNGGKGIAALPFTIAESLVSSLRQKLKDSVPFRIGLALILGGLAGGLLVLPAYRFLVNLVKGEALDPRMQFLAFVGWTMFSYLFVVCLAQILVDPRYMLAMMPFTVLLAFGSLLWVRLPEKAFGFKRLMGFEQRTA